MLSCINQQGKNPFLLSTLVIQRNLLLHHFNKDRCFYVQLSHNYIVIKVVCIMNVMVKNKIYGNILIWKEVIRSWILISVIKTTQTSLMIYEMLSSTSILEARWCFVMGSVPAQEQATFGLVQESCCRYADRTGKHTTTNAFWSKRKNAIMFFYFINLKNSWNEPWSYTTKFQSGKQNEWIQKHMGKMATVYLY